MKALAPSGPLIVVSLGFLLLPLCWTVWMSLSGPHGIGLQNYRRIWESAFLVQSFKNSISISAWSSLWGTLLALGASMGIRRSPIRDRMLSFCNSVSNFSGVPLAFAFIVILGTQGAVTILLRRWGLSWDLYSNRGLTVLYTYFQLPLGILTLYPALDGVGRDLKEAARTLGASDARFWAKVGIPILMPSIRGTFCLLFANAMGAYATAYALTSGASNLVPLRISSMVAGDVFLDFNLASAMSSLLLIATLCTVAPALRAGGPLGSNEPAARQDTSPGEGVHWSVAAVTWGTIGFLALPVGATLLHSFSSTWGASILPDGLSLKWYRQLLGDPRFLYSVLRSLGISAGAVILASALVIPPLVITRCFAPRWQPLLEALCVAPLAVPPVVSSVGLLSLYSPTPIGGTPLLLLLSYSVLCLPFVGRSVSSALSSINPRDMMEAAMTLGMSQRQALARAVLPNLWKGIVSGGLISFTVLMGEFALANIIIGTRFETMQIYIFNRRGVSGHLMSAMVMIHFAMASALSYAAWRAVNRRSKRRRLQHRSLETLRRGRETVHVVSSN
ncbi:MAG: ABC transporter permease subunit [Thermanaerothrix sp.]|nr:ABC transporter permease subunit [Thermanaerothrix sp.]